MTIKKDYLIEKRNVLNEIRSNNMTLQELRFFSIYLAKINSRDISTRVVHFSKTDFIKIMEIDFMNVNYLTTITNSLLCKVVNVPLETGGYKAFQLFKGCRVDKDEIGEWYVEIDAHDEALPLMFDFKDRYFTYELWNALRLKSANQLRMYELLKQYEKLGTRVFSIVELKELLGLDKNEYLRYNNLKSKIIDVCQEALEKYTDIKFTCEPAGKLGQGGKIKNLRFTISRNENYIDPLSLADFIDFQNSQTEFTSERLEFLSEACNNEFNEAELQVIYNLILKILPSKIGELPSEYQLNAYDYLKRRYDELNWRASRTEIKNRFAYIRKLLEADIITENQD